MVMDVIPYQCVIFDCDGVVLDSNRLKTKAFRQTLSGEDEKLVDCFIDYHQENGGLSRHIKFNYFYKTLKNDPDFRVNAQKAVAIYVGLLKDQLTSSAVIPGCIEFLKDLKKRNVPCYILTGGSQEEVQDVMHQKNLSQYFEKILGDPISKMEHATALQNEGCIKLPGVYFGDSLLDYEIARQFSLDFIFVSGASEWKNGRQFCQEHNVRIIDHFLF